MKTLSELQTQLSTRRIDRREFMRGVSALGLGAATMATLLGAPKPVKAEPKRGGVLKLGANVGGTGDTLDAANFLNTADILRGMQVYDRLVHVGPDMVPRGHLAEDFEPNATADEWTFKLRKGVTFHNGKPFTAADVIYTFNRLLDPAVGSGIRETLTQIDMASTKVEGDHIVRFKLVAPNADFPAILHDFHMQIVADGTTDFDKGIGTGPFVLETFKPGIISIVKRNENYWRGDRPYLDGVETVAINDPTARLNALLTGEIHVMEAVEGSHLDKIADSPDVQLFSAKSGKHVVYVMNTEAAPYNNRDVRNGLKHLIDREQFIQLILKGQGTVGNDHSIAPVDPWYRTDIPVRAYDPDKAKFLLKKGGAEGATFDLSTAPVAGNLVEAALLLQENAAKAGVTINVIREASDSYWSVVWLKKPFCMSQWNQRPVTDMMLSIAYLSTASWNDTHWKRPDFDKLVLQARGELDPVKRKELYWECQRMIHEDGGYIIPAFENVLDAGLSKVQGFEPHPLANLGFWQSDGLWLEA